MLSMVNLLLYRWLRPDWHPSAGMTAIELAVPTGYTIARDTIMAMYANTGISFSPVVQVRYMPRTLRLKRARLREPMLFILLEWVSILHVISSMDMYTLVCAFLEKNVNFTHIY